MFDVFVSFRDTDTRRTFVSHLLLSLSKEGIRTYKHENEPASAQVLQAIQESKIGIVVISKNYTSSPSCLDELATIMECAERQSLTVIPVLYEVGPSEVLRQTDDLWDHGDGNNKNSKKVKSWRDALAKAIQIYQRDYSYWEDEDSYSYIIDRVMIHVTNCLRESETLSKSDDVRSEAVVLSNTSCKISNAIRESKTMYSNLKIRMGLVFFGVALVGAVLGMIAERFMDREEPYTFKPLPAGSFEGVGKPFSFSYWPAGSFVDEKRPFLNVSDTFLYLKPISPNLTIVILIMIILIGLLIMGIELVRAAIWTRAGRFMDGKKPISLKPRPPGSLVDVQKDKYVVTSNKLSQLVFSNNSSSLVGMAQHTKAVTTFLDLDFKEGVRETGIWGVRGVGKTTLARCVYERISPQFQDNYYYMKDTKIFSTGRYSTCLLEEITRTALMPTSESEGLEEVVKAKLGHRKVLLIVDDLFHSSQLKIIRKFSRWFGPGSRLILVSHDTDILLQCEVKHLYEVESLRYDEALQLFSQFAFKQSHVPRGFERLSIRAVLITGRIPLSLRVFGSFLCGKCINEWESVLCRLEASQDNCVAKVSSYIGDAFS